MHTADINMSAVSAQLFVLIDINFRIFTRFSKLLLAMYVYEIPDQHAVQYARTVQFFFNASENMKLVVREIHSIHRQ